MPRKKQTAPTADVEGKPITRTASFRGTGEGEGDGSYFVNIPASFMTALGATAGESTTVAMQVKDGILQIKPLSQINLF